ncbi:MAG: ATP-dependent DNA ligase [Candidatus Woesearchaeota archaeon]
MYYSDLCDYYDKIDSTAKRLEKVDHIAELIRNCECDSLREIIFLLQGKVFPEWDERKLGVSTKLVMKALNVATGISMDEIEKEWKKTGDLGNTGENILKNKRQQSLFSSRLSISKVFDNLQKLASLEGSGSVDRKVQLISELLTSASPLESKYIIRSVLGELRVGASQGTLRDSIIKAYFPEPYEKRDSERKEEYKEILDLVQNCYDMTNDFSKIVEILEESGREGLEKISLEVFRPVNPMLFPKAKDITEAFKIVGKPAIIEYKYDGFRVQIHKKDDTIKLYTRRLEDVTKQFPDVVEQVSQNIKIKECVLDAEILGKDKDTGRLLPFQKISQRIRRKHGIEKIIKELPVAIRIFDIIKMDEKDLLDTEFSERRRMLENITEKTDSISVSESLLTESEEEANSFYEKALLKGHEGMMMKSLSKGYKPGARVGYAVKLKPILEPLDLVITKAEWGHGKRAGWLTSYYVSCRQEDRFLEVGKVGTGIKELESEDSLSFKKLTSLLKPLITKDRNTFADIKPKIIVEVDYEEIQKSNNYDSGFALRFPRIKRLREDIKEPSSIGDIKRIYDEQRGRNI